jgi:hypothetical protein
MSTQRGLLFQPTFAIPMAAVCVLVGAFLIYYFPITARQGATIDRLAFRGLAAASDSLSARVGNYAEVVVQRSKRPPDTEVSGDFHAHPDFFVHGGEVGDCQEEAVRVGVNVLERLHSLQVTCGTWAGDVPLSLIVAPHQRTFDELFDEILVTDADGGIVHQSTRTGGRISRIDSSPLRRVSEVEAGADASEENEKADALPFLKASQASTLLLTEIAGEQYRLYVVPVSINLPPADGASPRYALVGLISARRFRAESMAVPGTETAAVVLLVLVLLVAAWPLLMFKTMGATERIPRRSAAYLFLSMLATLVLVCILAIHLWYTGRMDAVDERLRMLAERIDTNLASELRVALRVLGAASRSTRLDEMMAMPAADCKGSLSTADMIPKNRLAGGLLASDGLRTSDYPYFDRVFWSDSRGYQHVKWEAGRETAPTFVGDRQYFVETVANRLWRFAGAPGTSPRFRVDSILSRNTGEYRAIISQAAPRAVLCDGVTLSVVSMVTPLLSLIDPVMPPEYGFAVVDADGLVQFHSNSTKNGAERFFDEVDDPDAVRAAMFARRGTSFDVRYVGVDHRLFVTPLATLEDSPWSLIVFHNLSDGSARHLERILLFSLLAVAYLVIVAVVLLCVPGSRRPQDWMWPREAGGGVYVHLALTLLVIFLPVYLLLFGLSSPAAVLFVSCLVPVMAFALAAAKVASLRPVVSLALLTILAAAFDLVVWLEPESRGYLGALCVVIIAALALLGNPALTTWLGRAWKPSLATSYAWVWAALLAFTAVLPCIGFFRVAHDYHGNISTRRQQVQTLAALEAREAWVKKTYGERAVTTSPAREEVARWLFVRRRLEETLDRYDLVLTAGAGTLISTATSGSDCDGGLPGYLQAFASWGPYADATQAHALKDGASPQRAVWTWCRQGVNRLRVTGRSVSASADADALRLPPTRALFKSVTDDPVFLFPELVSELPVLRARWWPLPWLAFAAIAFIAFLCVRPTLRKMFLLDVASQDPLPRITLAALETVDENLILLTTERTEVMSRLRPRADVSVIDCATLKDALPAKKAIPGALVVLDRFDHGMDDDAANKRKLRVLEWLRAESQDKRIVIVSAVDPGFFFGPDSDLSDRPSLEALAAGQDMDRWGAALDGLAIRCVATAAAGDTLVRRVWAACTTAERVSLYQLAHDGWVNPKNEAALQELEKRGLITGRPVRFANDALRTFVVDWVGDGDRKTWAQKDAARVWGGIRMTFVVIILAVAAAALFFSQRAVLGLIATGLGVLTPLTQLLSEADSVRSLLFGKPK